MLWGTARGVGVGWFGGVTGVLCGRVSGGEGVMVVVGCGVLVRGGMLIIETDEVGDEWKRRVCRRGEYCYGRVNFGVGGIVGPGGREPVLSQADMGERWLVVGSLSLMRRK